MNANTVVTERRGPRLLGAFAVPGRPKERQALAWWLWPHVVSLDAPLVAVAWQHWWAHAAGVRLAWFEDVILALGVWMIYLADRLADTRLGAAWSPNTARHAFSARNRFVLQPLLVAVVIALAVLTLAELSWRQFTAGLGLLLTAGGYFWLIHRQRPSRWNGVIPKEAFVGAIFAFGTTFFVAWQGCPSGWRFPVSGGLFAVLCFLNCALITRWETSAKDLCEPALLLHAFPGLAGRLDLGCVGLAALAGVLAASAGSGVFLPILLSALALAWLDHRRARLSLDALRVLADLALLTPILCGGWLRW